MSADKYTHCIACDGAVHGDEAAHGGHLDDAGCVRHLNSECTTLRDLVADLVEALEQAKWEHDDNCPHDDPDVMECRCGAAEHNAPIDTALAVLRAAGKRKGKR